MTRKSTPLSRAEVNEVKSRTAKHHGGNIPASSGAAVLDSIIQKRESRATRLPTPRKP